MPAARSVPGTAAVLCAVVLVVGSCTGGGNGQASEGLPTEPFDPGVEVGDCFDRPQSPDVESVTTVDCATPHDFEAYALVDLEGDSYPGDDQVDEQARVACEERFADYVGVGPGESGLVIVPVAPDAEAWEAEVRTVTCTVTVRADEPLTGSVQGSEQPAG